MQRFWLVTWDLGAAAPGAALPGAPIAASGARRLAIEVLQDGAKYVVLISAADGLQETGRLRCLIGFANGARECSLWRSRGFPVVEAAIGRRDGWLELFSPFFEDKQSAMQYGKLLLALRGIDIPAPEGPVVVLETAYDQFQEAPQRGKPASFVLRRDVRWDMRRTQVRSLGPRALEILAPSTRSPSLLPLADGTLAITHGWAGRWEEPQPKFSDQKPAQVPRHEVFGAAAFAFRDIEVLGFRIDLGDKDADDLVASLNSQQPGEPGDAVRFRVPRPVVLVQLLRYGSMQLDGDPQPPMDATDFQSQHELVVRVDTGRVEAGEADLLDRAVHVPAIFVDNPWSKLLGRDLQGFEKCLADFCVRAQDDSDTFLRLRPNGVRVGGGAASDLSEVARINLVDVVSETATSSDAALLEIEFDNLDPVDQVQLESADLLGEDALIEFGAPVVQATNEFASIQATPVDERPLEKAWISAICTLTDRAEEETPSAIAHLVFHSLEAAPRGWRTFCELLGAPPGGRVKVAIQPGDWFRSRFSMQLKVLDQ